LDDALLEKDPIKRLGLIGVYASVYPTNFEKLPSKPFNPLLGETFELVVPGKYKFFSEQVSHHPPICASILLGDKGYSRETIFRVKNKLSGGGLALTNMYKDYINIDCYGERFLIIPPTLVIHNLIIGEPYMDAGNHGYVRNVASPNKEYVDIKFHKRGWSEKTHSKIEGEVYSAPGKVEYRITGKWNSTVQLIHAETNEVVYTWNKEPNPDNYEYMYGYTRHTLQFNYLTDSLAAKIAPTDSRLRPDQRALENGDFKFAASEKNRLEEKQRAVRKYREAMKI
jgi:oxysterol-binding protein 1